MYFNFDKNIAANYILCYRIFQFMENYNYMLIFIKLPNPLPKKKITYHRLKVIFSVVNFSTLRIFKKSYLIIELLSCLNRCWCGNLFIVFKILLFINLKKKKNSKFLNLIFQTIKYINDNVMTQIIQHFISKPLVFQWNNSHHPYVDYSSCNRINLSSWT